MSAPPPTTTATRKTCALCARRKVKCDKKNPCSNCVKAQTECCYEPLAPPKPRKRAADEDLLARLARYEQLMGANNIDFQSQKNVWVPSAYENKLKKDSDDVMAHAVPMHDVSPSLAACPSNDTSANLQRCSWSDLSQELRYPPIQFLRHREDPLMDPTPPLGSIISITHPQIHELHPEPRHIYRLWQVFVESVNPMIKVIHTPSLQQQILDASSDPSTISPSLTAILFAIYTLAVTSMKSDDCQNLFGETRRTLLLRYRTATLRALLHADFLATKNLEVLQALVLFLFSDPDSELTSTLSSAGVRIAQKMGLHRANIDPKLSIFEKEMCARLWWQLFGLDARSRALIIPGWKLAPGEFGDLPSPLNINDTDLHPDMTEPPVEYNGPTDMMCVLLKFEVFKWVRSSPSASKILPRVITNFSKHDLSMPTGDEATDELEAIYREKYLKKLDKCIPLHQIAYCMAKLAVARMRFKIHHPRNRVVAGGSDAYMSQQEIDLLFENALMILEMIDRGIKSKFSTHLFTHMASTFQLDTYIFLLSELRHRCSGDQVALAWKLIASFYDEQPQIIDDTERPFFVALGDLTLEAWSARRAELLRDRRTTEAEFTPPFIHLLEEKKQIREAQAVLPMVLDSQNVSGFGVLEDDYLNWDYWNEF